MKTKLDFKKIKCGSKLEERQGQYEVHEAEDEELLQKLWVLTLFKCNEQLANVFYQTKCTNMLHPENIYKIDANTYNLTFIRIQAPQYFDTYTEINESQLWSWFAQFVNILVECKQQNIYLNGFNKKMITIEKFTNQLQLYCYGDASLKQNTDNIQLCGQFLNELKKKLYTPHSTLLQYLTQSLESQPLITLEQLHDHPILKPNDNSKCLEAHNEFHLADFKHLKELGAGAYGRCDLVQYVHSLEYCVLKSTTNTKAQDLEVSAMQAISHPNVVRFYGAFTENRTYYIVMQYCEGGDLYDRLTKNSLPDSEVLKQWLSQLCSAIHYMHAQRMIHRDIKPQNVLISNGQAMLADFGVSREVDEFAETVIGTPLYFSPEQHFRQHYNFSADIFSLGLVFFNMCVGSHPFTSQPGDAANFYNYCKKHGSAHGYMKYIKDPLMNQLVSKMLVFEPLKRATAEELCQFDCVQQYLTENCLPGPKQPTLLTSAHTIQYGVQLMKIVGNLEQLNNVIKIRLLKQLPQCQKYLKLAFQLIPYYYQQVFIQFVDKLCVKPSHVKEQIEKVSKNSAKPQTIDFKQNDQFQEYMINYESNKVALELGKQLQQTLQNNQVKFTNSTNVQIITGGSILQINSMLNQLQQLEEININLTTAIYFNSDIQIKAKTVVIVSSHLIVQKQCTLTVISEELGIVGFQKHNGEQLQINIGTGSVYLDSQIKKVICNKEAKVREFGEVVRANQQVNQLIGLCNFSFPLQFAGGKGFWVGTQGWE